MKPKVKVSCVLPTYNRVAWLGECIDSLRRQKGFKKGEIEIIVVDDASTDTTNELMKYYTKIDENIKYILNANNQGAGISRNIGNKAAKGEVILICDSDDFYPPDRAKVSYDYLKKHKGVDFITGSYWRVNYSSKYEDPSWFFKARTPNKKEMASGNGIYFCHPASAYRTKDILKMPYKKESPNCTDDYMMLYDWIKAGKKLVGLKKVLCFHRVLPGSIMTNMRGGSLE